MKIALISGNYEKQGFPPLGVLYLAAYLRKEVPETIIDVYDVFPEITHLLEKNYDIIGLSAMSYQYPVVSVFANNLRAVYSGIIFLGGVHISLSKELPAWADIGIIGEGEQTLAQLVSTWKGLNSYVLSNIPGIIFRLKGNVIKTLPRGNIENLDNIPYPARDLIDMEAYLKDNNVYGTVIGRGTSLMTSRGCSFHCDYCSSSAMWNKMRFASAEYVISEIELLENIYRTEHLWVVDDHFMSNIHRLRKMAELYEQKKLKTKLGINGRIETYTKENSEILQRLGVKAIAFGLETGSDDMLRAVKHGQKLCIADERRIVEQAVEDGFQVHGMFMLNLPGETRESIRKTMDFIRELPLSKFSIAIATPFMGTKWWDIAVEQGIVPEKPSDDFWRSYNMQELHENRPLFKTELSREELIGFYSELTDYQRKLFYFDWRNR